MEIEDRLLRIAFDTAVNSLDFGSGFLDDEEVAALRDIAVLLGVDPAEATPVKFRCKYRGSHAARVYLDSPYISHPVDGAWCNGYRREEDFPEHVRPYLQGRKPGYRLGVLRLHQLVMVCTDCGKRWDALEEIENG